MMPGMGLAGLGMLVRRNRRYVLGSKPNQVWGGPVVM